MLIRNYVEVRINDIWKVNVSLYENNSKHSTLIQINNVSQEDGVISFVGLLYESSEIYSSDRINFLELVEKVTMDF